MSSNHSESASHSTTDTAASSADEEQQSQKMNDTDNQTAKEQYKLLAQSLRGKEMHYNGLLDLLGLRNGYNAYLETTADICDSLIDTIPTLNSNNSHKHNSSYYRQKLFLIQWFCSIYRHMSCLDFSRYPSAKPQEPLRLTDGHNLDEDGSLGETDRILYYKEHLTCSFSSAHVIIIVKPKHFSDPLPHEVLGQMAYYAKCVWEKQYTRTFVPVIFLHGRKIDMFIFARRGYRRVPLGMYINDANVRSGNIQKYIANTIRRLWFLLIQPSEIFGHFVNVSSVPCYLRFDGAKKHAAVMRIGDYEDHDESTVIITGRINRAVDISGRAAYLLNARYQGKDAILKLSWIPVDRQPEGVLYDLLNDTRHKVDCIPEVFRSGILIPDFLEYRLEFILMEFCGKPLFYEFKSKGQTWSGEHRLLGYAESAITKITACLFQARRAGVYHRDISSGNITLRGGDVFLIDWGCGKAIPDALDGKQVEKINAEWGIDIDDLTDNEDALDGMTGTVHYMGVRVLMGRYNRSIFDDIESLLYVLLDSISYIGSEHSGMGKFGLKDAPNETRAAAKIGYMLSRNHYQKHFGVTKCSQRVSDMLDMLYDMVFMRDDRFIGSELMNSKSDIRKDNNQLLCNLLGKELFVNSTGFGLAIDGSVDSYIPSAPPHHSSLDGSRHVSDKKATPVSLSAGGHIITKPPFNKKLKLVVKQDFPRIYRSRLRQPSASLLPRLDAMHIYRSNPSTGMPFKRKSSLISSNGQDIGKNKVFKKHIIGKFQENFNPRDDIGL